MKVTNIKIKEGFFNFKKDGATCCEGCPFFTSDDSLNEYGEWDGDVVVGCALRPHSHILSDDDYGAAAEEEIFKGCPIISIEETEE